MRATILVSIGLAVALSLATGCAEPYATFGEPMQISSGDAVDVGDVLADKTSYDGKEIVVKGTVREVCEHKGCWITLGEPDADETVFVKFVCPLEGRLVPMAAVGHTAIVHGTLTVEEVTEDEARHMAEDAGKSEAEIAKIVGPQKRIRMASPAVKIMGLEASPEGA